MDLHRELNELQRRVASEILDGANVYGISESDRALVVAFMAGVNSTAPLKFDHPGLGTTATRVGDRLVLQNDIGTTDNHVVVLHIVDLAVTIDVHRCAPGPAAILPDSIAAGWFRMDRHASARRGL